MNRDVGKWVMFVILCTVLASGLWAVAQSLNGLMDEHRREQQKRLQHEPMTLAQHR